MDGVRPFAKNVLSIMLSPLLGGVVDGRRRIRVRHLLKDSKAWSFAILGALIGSVLFPIRQWLASGFASKVRIDAWMRSVP